MKDITVTIRPAILPTTFTQAAADRVKELNSDHIRLSVSSGGCSGYQYKFTIDEPPTEDDTIVETDGIKLVIDNISIQFVNGSTVDFESDVMASQFVVKDNPNSTGMCGCGVSFQV